MIPHAEDNGCISADAEQLILMVVPGFRWKSEEDVEAALAGMHELGLIEWDRAAALIRFPESFFKHQQYITEKRRAEAARVSRKNQPRESARICENPRENAKVAEICENPREFAKIAAMFSSSVLSSVLVSSPVSSLVSESTDSSGISPEERGEKAAVAAGPKPLLMGFIGAWNSSLAELGFTPVRGPTPSRLKHFGARVGEARERASPEFWERVVAQIASSDWLCRSAREGAPWLRFDWFLRESNLTKLLEGQYHRARLREAPGGASGRDPDEILREFFGGTNGFGEAVGT